MRIAVLARGLTVILLGLMAAGIPPAARAMPAAAAGWQVVAPIRTPPILYWPAGVAVGGHGTMYVADTDGRAVLALSPDGTVVRQWTRAGTQQLLSPRTLTIDGFGHLYVGDASAGTVSVFTTAGRFLRSWRVAPASLTPNRGTPFPLGAGDGKAIWVALGLRIIAFSPAGGRLHSWYTHIRTAVNNRFPCVLSTGTCPGDIIMEPLGITEHAGHVFILL